MRVTTSEVVRDYLRLAREARLQGDVAEACYQRDQARRYVEYMTEDYLRARYGRFSFASKGGSLLVRVP